MSGSNLPTGIATRGGGKGTDPAGVPSTSSSKGPPGLVTVMGFDKDDVLFRSDQARTVQWRDAEGKIAALLVKLRPEVWGFSRVGDDDWKEVVEIYGNPDV